MNCLLLHFHKHITFLSVDLLRISQVSSVSFKTVCWWIMTNGCFKSGISLYIPLHEPVFSTIAPVITFVSRVSEFDIFRDWRGIPQSASNFVNRTVTWA